MVVAVVVAGATSQRGAAIISGVARVARASTAASSVILKRLPGRAVAITCVGRRAFNTRSFARSACVRRITLASAVRASAVSYTSSAAVGFVAQDFRTSRKCVVLGVRGTCTALSCASVCAAYLAAVITSSKIRRTFTILKSLNYIIIV